ncbi:MAG: rhodanese-like domain-containing protein [Pyrinomonadaceae bacterium MAG19_C2-C3]|nr:rhodanese-like domain-containing protein [Pyrinomonadaceae bacterium MAG19_C2-C3]
MTDVPYISVDELKAKLDAADPPFLFETLPADYFRHSHIPGAINMPPENILEIVTEHVADKNAEIVVYCLDTDCHSAEKAARKLMALGYTNVFDFAGGKKAWAEAGLPLERHARRDADATA